VYVISISTLYGVSSCYGVSPWYDVFSCYGVLSPLFSRSFLSPYGVSRDVPKVTTMNVYDGSNDYYGFSNDYISWCLNYCNSLNNHNSKIMNNHTRLCPLVMFQATLNLKGETSTKLMKIKVLLMLMQPNNIFDLS